jgi:hypothetical protein
MMVDVTAVIAAKRSMEEKAKRQAA